MPYKDWKRQVEEHICIIPTGCTLEEDYPTVDFRHLYKAGFEPAKAAIHWFTKSKYKPVA